MARDSAEKTQTSQLKQPQADIANPSPAINESGTYSEAHLKQPDQDKETQICEKPTDALLSNSSIDRNELSKEKKHTLDSHTGEGRQIGVLFENLSVHGSASSTSTQPTVVSALVSPIKRLAKLLGGRHSRQTSSQILYGLDGLLCPGELLLVLGRPGSGCSTFLKAVCGYLDGLSLDPASKIQYQSISLEILLKEYRGEVVYNAEEDYHFPHLTVGETLEFAASSRAPHTRAVNVSRGEYVKAAVQAVMDLYGLSHTKDTHVGNEYIRGVSGGERKRVSIAEMTLARAPIGAWDNSTRGLDANSALDFAQALRLSADVSKTCHAAAVYQASDAIYNTFDNVILLYEGHQIYFGPCRNAVPYFEEMGWKRHPRQVSADFLTAITNPSEREPRKGMESSVPRTPEEFEARWKQSPEYASLRVKMNRHAEAFPSVDNKNQANHIRYSSPYLISVPMQLRLCLVRAYRRNLNDLAGIISTAIVQIVLAVLIGSLFYNIPNDSSGLSQRASVIFLAVLTNNLISLLEINVLYSQRAIVEKHANYAFVRPFTEAFASVIIDLPVKLLRCLLASIVIYFMANLRREAGHFFIYILFQLTSVVTMSGLFRCLATMTKTLGQAMALGGIIIICIAVYTGYTVPQPDMRPWLGWIRWINPIFYAFEGVISNEFHGLKAICVNFVPDYPHVLGSSFTCSVVGSTAGQLYVSGDVFIEKNYQYSHSHLWRNFGIIVAFLVFFHAAYLILTELVPGTASSGNTLCFLSRNSPDNPGADDLESRKQSGALREVQSSRSHLCLSVPQQRRVFSWKGLSYDIPVKGGTKRLLDDVNGWAKPGTLTALMGLSGAGKTTLLDVLAQRMTVGVVTGEMLVDGNNLNASFRRNTGYVEQHDLHLESSTIREALRFSAALRQPRSTPIDEKYEFVEDVIHLLGMGDFSDAIIGIPGHGLNIEQRKLLTIGVELAAKPELLTFLDEPTSGLDSQSSWAICAFMRKLADHGQAVLATIHQPGAVMFEQFDRLLLLAQGGRPVYFGDIGSHSRTLLDYLESNGARPCGPTENPAEYMLDVVNQGPQENSQALDWVDIWKKSAQNQAVIDELDRMASTPSQTPTTDTPKELEFAMPVGSQIHHVLKRDFQQYYRQPEYIMAKLSLGIVSGLFIGFSFWMSDESNQGFQNTMFSLFLLCTIFSTMVNQILPKFIGRRALYELRERPSRTYSWQVFIFSQILVELPWQALLGICTWASFYFSVYGGNQDSERQCLVFLFVLQFFLFASSFAHLIAAAIPNPILGSMLALFMFVLSLLSNGVMQAPSNLPPFWSYMHRVSPLTYYVGGISATALHGRPIHCTDREVVSFDAPAGQTCGEYLREYLEFAPGRLLNWNSTSECQYCPLRSADQYLASRDIFWDLRWRDYGLLWAYFAFNILAAISLYYLFRVLPYSRKNKVKKT
ncbi:hypothetical protein N7470_005813 [Penicillium chermesinum]|nr:hypothetical protein N7470_005813 [Penicillium chermesinum]